VVPLRLFAFLETRTGGWVRALGYRRVTGTPSQRTLLANRYLGAHFMVAPSVLQTSPRRNRGLFGRAGAGWAAREPRKQSSAFRSDLCSSERVNRRGGLRARCDRVVPPGENPRADF
jgi:hypothetical protein